MKETINLEEVKKEITQVLEEKQTPHITLDVPSMLYETPEKIKSVIASFNQVMDYLIKNGKQCVYITAEQNEPISYDELMLLENIVNKSKQEIQSKGAKTVIEKARIIEHLISHEFPTIVCWGDEDFYSSCDKNLVQALQSKRGSCCHFAALTQYLHLRNNMYSDIIYSGLDIESDTNGKICHMFNLLFLDDEERNWTFVDTMWEKEYIKLRGPNSFSFVSLEDIQNNPSDVDKAHLHIEQDLSNVSTVTVDMENVDRKLGYQNKVCLFQYSYFIAYHIAHGNIDKVKEIFAPENKTIENMLGKNSMIQFIGFIAYISAIELGKNGLLDKEQRPDESAMMKCIDTYLRNILPEFYAMFFQSRIKLTNPAVLNSEDSLKEYVTSLFQIVTKEDGNVGIYFNDTIDKAYIEVDFTDSKSLPAVNVLNRIDFEKRFREISDHKTALGEKADYEIEYQ